MRVFLYVVACEALVQLFFYAMPLQKLRYKLIAKTPWLRVDYFHLFECKYCVSFWVGVLCMFGFLSQLWYIDAFVYALVFHRLSNFLHLIFSLTLDKQFDIRIARGRNGNI